MATAQFINIWNEVKTILQADATLGVYIDSTKQFFEGVPGRTRYVEFPVLIMEPGSEGENEEPTAVDQLVDMTYEIMIYAIIKVADYKKQIVGDATYKGITQIVADIKNALEVYPKLNKSGVILCKYFEFPSILYGTSENFAERVVEITMRINSLRQVTGR